jgi:eukaryotic-like serine/threonine-protein kinase
LPCDPSGVYDVSRMSIPGKEIKGTQGKYYLLNLLSRGGMAEIWLARQTDLGGKEHIVVVKTIRSDLTDQQKYNEMFLDEIRITSYFQHPNVVHIVEKGKLKGNYFLIMEYLDGESLAYLASQAMNNGHRIPRELAAAIIAQACDGLGHAHALRDKSGKQMNVIHRDVSPQNIIVLFSGRVKVIDFGIAAASKRVHETRTGVTKGKLSYMSPEQCQGKVIDARTDIFSLGIVLWELLSGRRLFKHSVDLHTLRAIVSGEIPSISEFRPDVSRELETIAMRALQAEPKNRYASAERMSAALKLFISNCGTKAGEYQISQFYLKVLPDRVSTKQRLLEELISKEAGSKELAVLKPDTDASMPSFPENEAGSSPEVSPPAVEQDDDIDESEATETQEVVVDTEGSPRPTVVAPPDLPSKPDYQEPGKAKEAQDAEIEESPAASKETVVEKRPMFKDGSAATRTSPAETSASKISTPKAERPVFNTKLITIAAVAFIAIVAVILLSLGKKEPVKTGDFSVPDSAERPDAGQLLEPSERQKPARPAKDIVEPEDDALETPVKTPVKAPTKTKPAENVKKVLKAKKPPAPRILKYGLLRLNTDPWCEAYLGKRKLGITPLLGVKLPKGRHKLRLINKGMGIDKIISVRIRPGKTTSLLKKLDKN